jgi:hypothetical protein
MERTSRIAWVPKGELEGETIKDVYMDKETIIQCFKDGLFLKKKSALEHTDGGEVEKVRVTVTVDVERL